MDTSALKKELALMIETAPDMAALENVRVNALGKKGRITDLMKTLGSMSPDERKEAGSQLNLLKDEISELIETQALALKQQELDARIASDGGYLLLQRMGVMAPLLGVVLTVAGAQLFYLQVPRAAGLRAIGFACATFGV